MKRIVSYKPSLGETALAILDDVVTATLKTLYPHPYYHQFCQHTHHRSFANAVRRLERKNLVGIRTRDGQEFWSLTKEGEKFVRLIKARMHYAGNQRWDKKWRLVVFDIPEKIRGRRDYLRKELNYLGFHQLQKSVWVSPYPLPPEFSEIVSELNLGKNYRLVVAESVDSDSDLRALFFPSV